MQALQMAKAQTVVNVQSGVFEGQHCIFAQPTYCQTSTVPLGNILP